MVKKEGIRIFDMHDASAEMDRSSQKLIYEEGDGAEGVIDHQNVKI